MKIYEKAVENYAKARNEFHKRAQKAEVAIFNEFVERMTADGRCPEFECRFCPIRLAADTGIEVKGCGAMTPQEVREILAMEVNE